MLGTNRTFRMHQMCVAFLQYFCITCKINCLRLFFVWKGLQSFNDEVRIKKEMNKLAIWKYWRKKKKEEKEWTGGGGDGMKENEGSGGEGGCGKISRKNERLILSTRKLKD